MKFLILALFVGMARAASVSDQVVPIVRSISEVNADSFRYSYETGNGIISEASGNLKNDALAVQGQYKYPSPDGAVVELSYIADENGFQPQGSHLPTPHPVPEHIQKSLEWIAAHPPPPESAVRKFQ